MDINVTTPMRLEPTQLAEALFKADPEDFAEFWFEFDRLTDGNREGALKLRSFAEAMAPRHGANRKRPLKTLSRLMEYYETREEIERR